MPLDGVTSDQRRMAKRLVRPRGDEERRDRSGGHDDRRADNRLVRPPHHAADRAPRARDAERGDLARHERRQAENCGDDEQQGERVREGEGAVAVRAEPVRQDQHDHEVEDDRRRVEAGVADGLPEQRPPERRRAAAHGGDGKLERSPHARASTSSYTSA